MTVVFDDGPYAAIPLNHQDVGGAGTPMASRVGQCLLDDAIQRGLDGRGQALAHVDVNVDQCPREANREVLGAPLQCGFQAEIVQDARPQLP